MFTKTLKSFSLLIVIVFLFFSCKGGENQASTMTSTENTVKQTEQRVEKKTEMNPDELARKLGIFMSRD